MAQPGNRLTPGMAMLSVAALVTGIQAAQQRPATFTSIDIPGAVATGGPMRWLGINPRGDVVGAYRTDKAHGFMLRAGEVTSFDDPSSTAGTFANAISPEGDIVGGYFAGAFAHSYILSDGAFTSFDPPGALISFALGINARGEIVGVYNAGSTNLLTGSRGYLLTDGAFTSIVVPDAVYRGGTGINSEGTVVGRYQSGDGRVHGYVLYSTTLSLVSIFLAVLTLIHAPSILPATSSERIKAPTGSSMRSCKRAANSGRLTFLTPWPRMARG